MGRPKKANVRYVRRVDAGWVAAMDGCLDSLRRGVADNQPINTAALVAGMTPPSGIDATSRAVGVSVEGYVKKIEELEKKVEAAGRTPKGVKWADELSVLESQLDDAQNLLRVSEQDLEKFHEELTRGEVVPRSVYSRAQSELVALREQMALMQ